MATVIKHIPPNITVEENKERKKNLEAILSMVLRRKVTIKETN